jgi:hypothetical protein
LIPAGVTCSGSGSAFRLMTNLAALQIIAQSGLTGVSMNSGTKSAEHHIIRMV